MRQNLFVLVVAIAALTTHGCAAVGLTLFAVGAGVSAGAGTQYTLDGIAYRTFTAPLDSTRVATIASLKRMAMPIQTDESAPEGRTLIALAGDRTIDIELQSLTPQTTRIRVTAKYKVILRDRATAGEIIAQVERSLEEMPRLSQTPK